ncbi:Uncharacterised protein [Providencia stuartii]|nr:Uncharacterised protein [Providencia stuartii]
MIIVITIVCKVFFLIKNRINYNKNRNYMISIKLNNIHYFFNGLTFYRFSEIFERYIGKVGVLLRLECLAITPFNYVYAKTIAWL